MIRPIEKVLHAVPIGCALPSRPYRLAVLTKSKAPGKGPVITPLTNVGGFLRNGCNGGLNASGREHKHNVCDIIRRGISSVKLSDQREFVQYFSGNLPEGFYDVARDGVILRGATGADELP